MSITNICVVCNLHIKLDEITEGDCCSKNIHDNLKCLTYCATCPKACCGDCVKYIQISKNGEHTWSCKSCRVQCGLCDKDINIHKVTYRYSSLGMLCYRCCV